jgi:hypothetical protein
MNRLATIAIALALAGPALADGVRGPPGPPPGPPPLEAYPTPLPAQSCIMTAIQLAYQTGRRELAYVGGEHCLAAGHRGFVMPYGYYGPYVPPQGLIPPGWFIPRY